MIVDCGQLSCVLLMKIIIHEIFIPHAPPPYDDDDDLFFSKSYSLGFSLNFRIEFNYCCSEGDLNLNIYMTLNKDFDGL